MSFYCINNNNSNNNNNNNYMMLKTRGKSILFGCRKGHQGPR